MVDEQINNLYSDTTKTQKNSEKKNYHVEIYLFLIILFLTYLTIFYNYLLFHTIAELFSIVIGGGIFIICWNSRKRIDNSFFLVIGVSFLYVGFLDLIHSLAYPGMEIFTGYDTNLAAQLWIAARYTQAGSFLFASIVINKKIKINYLIIFYTIIAFILLVLIFIKVFPDCFIEGTGLTPFKIISEYIIDFLLFITIFMIYKQRFLFERKIYLTFLYSIIATIISELAFTLYVNAYGIPNLIGHIFKIISFFFLYKAIINIGLENPINLLFRKLKLSEKNLIAKASELEKANLLLKEAELRYRTIFEQSPDGFLVIDLETLRAVEFNDAVCKILGYTHEEFEKLQVNDYDVMETPSETRRHTEKVLREGKKAAELKTRLASIVESSEDAIIGKTLDGIITSWNKAAEKIYYYSAEEMLGKSIELLTPPNYDGEILEILTRIKRGEKLEAFETERIRKDGSKVNVSLTISPIKDTNNKIIGSSTIARDITEKKKAENKIRSLSKFPSENPNPVLRVNNEKVIYINKIGKNLFNINNGSLTPKVLEDSIKDALTNKKIQELEIKLDNRIYTLVVNPVENENYVNIYGMDITKRKKAEERLSQLISTVSHELRTPITVLLMSMEYLTQHKNTLNEDLETKLLDGVSRNIHLLNELAEDILLISRIDENRLELEWKEYKPKEIIKEILYLMEPIGKEKKISFEVDVDENIHLRGDSKRIDQVFRIIIDNAIKYSRENSKVEIRAINNYKGKYNVNENSGVLFEFKDYGRGISKYDLPKIFERFFRSSNVSEISGTGLGLAIAKDLIEAHKGNIYVESELEKGTTFYLYLPKIE